MPNGRVKQLWEESHYNNDDFDYEHDSGDQQLSDLSELLNDVGDDNGVS